MYSLELADAAIFLNKARAGGKGAQESLGRHAGRCRLADVTEPWEEERNSCTRNRGLDGKVVPVE